MSSNILIINFDAKTKDGLIAKNKRYKPAMSNEELYSMFPNILFIPTIRLKKSYFDKMLGEEDIKKIFLSPSQFNLFLTNLKIKYPELNRPITMAEAERSQIITDNIRFILNLFFSKPNKFYLFGIPYIINSYYWGNQWSDKIVPGQAVPQIVAKIKLFLHPGTELGFIESTKLTCMEKRNKIVDDFKTLTGKAPRLDMLAPVKQSPPLLSPYSKGYYEPPPKLKKPMDYNYTYAPTINYYGDGRPLPNPSAPPMPPGMGGRKRKKKTRKNVKRKRRQTRSKHKN